MNVKVPAGCGNVELCVADHECEDGDSIEVSVGGAEVFSGELSADWRCIVTSVAEGENSLEVVALNGSGSKGANCDRNDVNTAALQIRSGGVNHGKNLFLESIRGFTSTAATINVTYDGTGSCATAAADQIR